MATQSADQSTTLHIAIGGLCLLVRDEARTDGKKMLHVLFPEKIPGPAHHANLVVHPDYRVPADLNKPFKIPLDGVTLDLPSAINGQAEREVVGSTRFESVVDERCFHGGRVRRALLDKALDREVLKARITIAAGGQGTEKGEGVEWNLGDCRDRMMGTWVHWKIPGLPAGEVELRLGTTTLRLRPRNGRIELVFLHEMDLPIEPPRLSDLPTTYDAPTNRWAPHFHAFFRLLGVDDSHPVPTHGKPNMSEGHTHAPPAVPKAVAGLDYTCIMATAPAEPGP